MINTILAWDQNALISLQGIIPLQFALFIKIFAESIVIWIAIFLISCWLYGTFHKNDSYKVLALRVFLTIATVFIFYSILNFFIPQWRPHPSEIIPRTITPLIPHPLDNSFPSGHALFSGAAIMAMIWYVKKPIYIFITIVLAIVTVILRVVGGVHYPGDIIGGLIVGILGAIILRKLVIVLVEYISPYAIKIAKYIKL